MRTPAIASKTSWKLSHTPPSLTRVDISECGRIQLAAQRLVVVHHVASVVPRNQRVLLLHPLRYLVARHAGAVKLVDHVDRLRVRVARQPVAGEWRCESVVRCSP